MKALIYNQKGEKLKDIELPKELFGMIWKPDLVHQVAVSMMANRRMPWAHTKGRGEVAGGGKKPWRQKGTGRARHGSIRSPIWVGGGVAHGPTKEKDYSKKINKKMKRAAFLSALSQKYRDGEILFLDKMVLPETKTKLASEIMRNLSGIEGFEKLFGKKKNRAIIALPKKDREVELSFRNLAGVKVSEGRNLSLLDLLNYKYVIIPEPEKVFSFWK